MNQEGGWTDVVAWSLAKLLRGWKIICLCCISIASLAAIIAFSMDKVFEARTTLVCQQGKSKGMPMGMDLGGFLGLASGSDVPPALVQSVFKSDGLALYCIHRFRLDSVWKMEGNSKPRWENLIKVWSQNFNIWLDEENVLHVTFRDKSPELTAIVLLSAVRWADSTYLSLRHDYSEKNSSFLLRLMEERKGRMMAEEDSILVFQKTNKLIEPTFEVASSEKLSFLLQEQVVRIQTQMEMTRLTNGEAGSEFRQLAAQLKLLKNRLYTQINDPIGPGNLGLGGKSTRMGTWLEFERRKRDLIVDGAVYQVLVQQFEQSQIETRKDLPTFTTLDPVMTPSKKVSPPRMVIVFLGVVIGFFSGAGFAVFDLELKTFVSKFRSYIHSV